MTTSELSEIVHDLFQNPERCLVFELLSMAAEPSLSSLHLMLLASTLPEFEVGSLVMEYKSAVTNSPLYGTQQAQLYSHLTMILKGSLSARVSEIASTFHSDT